MVVRCLPSTFWDSLAICLAGRGEGGVLQVCRDRIETARHGVCHPQGRHLMPHMSVNMLSSYGVPLLRACYIILGTQWVQEDDVIGILASDNIADLKPLGDRLLVEVSLLTHAHMAVKFSCLCCSRARHRSR